jgi:DNA modification methylase
MKAMPDNSVDSIVTDPPYELGFMGKSWDASGIAFNIEVWQEALRVIKPGGHLIAFSGSRTYHRMAVAIEDAGFQIRDQIMWVYGSGFPKSHNISKGIDKTNGEPNRLLKFTTWMRTTGLKAKDIDTVLRSNKLISQTSNMAVHFFNDGQPQIATAEMWKVIRPLIADVPEWVDELVNRIEAEREVIGKGVDYGHQDDKEIDQEYGFKADYNITAPATAAAQQWDGWGTALKPAHEPIVLARKPLEGTIANNVLTFGVGGLNIDGTRVGTGSGETKTVQYPDIRGNNYNNASGSVEYTVTDQGRFPANFIHDGSDEVVALFPDTKSGGKQTTDFANEDGLFGFGGQPQNATEPSSGSAARFFYCAKASKRDRNEGLDGFPIKETPFGGHGNKEEDFMSKALRNAPRANHHPTVKPTSLMQYLVKLVTPPNGVVLDPFMGSGSTGKACAYEGFEFIGIDQSAEYVTIAQARIDFALADKSDELPL